MGFLDVDKSKKALVAKNGDIMTVIDDLVVGVLGPGVPNACLLTFVFIPVLISSVQYL